MYILSLGCLGGGYIFPISLCYLLGAARETQLAYVQRYVSPNITSASEFQVKGGQLRISAFERERKLGASDICSHHYHSIALMGSTLVALCCIM
jgi:hypothetical protein